MTKSIDSGKLYADSVISYPTKQDTIVYVIDDESEVRRSLHFLLSTADIVSWPFASASDFLENLESLRPAPILLDVRMPEIDGIQLMATLRERRIEWPIIVFTAHGEIRIAVQAMKLGAIEFLEKPFEFEALDFCLKAAFAKLAAVTDVYAVRDAARSRFKMLSPREMEVIDLLRQGVPNKTVAHKLSLSVRTVEMHRANALAKLQVKSVAEVVRLAAEAELLSPDTKRQDDDDGR